MSKAKRKAIEEGQTESTYSVTDPDGRVWLLRPLPKHFYLFFSQLPSSFTAKAVSAIKQKDEKVLTEDILAGLTPEQIVNASVFAREAVTYACVKPRITITPTSDDETEEISPFRISENAFAFLTEIVMSSGGSDANSVSKFR